MAPDRFWETHDGWVGTTSGHAAISAQRGLDKVVVDVETTDWAALVDEDEHRAFGVMRLVDAGERLLDAVGRVRAENGVKGVEVNRDLVLVRHHVYEVRRNVDASPGSGMDAKAWRRFGGDSSGNSGGIGGGH